MSELFGDIVEICRDISAVFALAVLFVKPLRKKFLNDEEQREGQKCLLRGHMLSIYYHNKDSQTIRQYEYENFIFYYKAYKALGGNSFIDHIVNEVNEWEIVS